MHALFSRNGLDVLHIGIFSQFSVATKPQKPVFVGCKRLSQRSYLLIRAVARSENPGGLVVMGGDNMSPLVEIGLTDMPKTEGAKAPPAPPLATGLT